MMKQQRWEKIKDLFDRALALPPDRRAPFVAEACGDDLVLRSEVEGLLDHDFRAGSFLQESASQAFAVAIRSKEDHLTFSPGQVVGGRFQVVRFIGRGGMGEVYEAKDLELSARIALKTLRPEISSDSWAVSRFKQEIHLARRVTHPNVCRMFDIAPHHDGRSEDHAADRMFITMELLEGEPLSEFLRKKGQVKIEEARPLIQQMADALQAAHEAGVIHRDFKPSNVVLVSTGGDSAQRIRAVVTDFGLARAATSSSLTGESFVQSLSMTGQILGTLAYMAPEQLEGREATPATDVYALGLVIYEMLTGRTPFPEHAPLAGAFLRIKEQPPSPRTHLPELDAACEETIMLCLRTDPSERLQSAREVSTSLFTPGAVSSRGVSTHSTAWAGVSNADRPAQRVGSLRPKARARLVWLSAGILLALLIAVWIRWSFRPRAIAPANSSQVTLAVLPFKNLSGERDTDYLRIALPDQIATILSYSSGIAVRPFASTEKYGGKDLDPQTVGQELKVANVVAGHFLRQGDRLEVTVEAIDVEKNQLLWKDTIKVGNQDLTSLDNNISAQTQQGLIPHVTSAGVVASAGSRPHSPEAYALYLRSLAMSHDAAANKQAILMLERAVTLDPSYAPAWQELAQRYYFQGHTGGTNADLDHSDEASQRALALNPDFPDAARSLTVSRTERGDLEGAYDTAQSFLRRRPNDSQAHGSMGYVLRYAGLIDESVREYETALALDPTNYILRSGALSIQEAGDYARAHDYIRVDAGSGWAAFNDARILLEWGKYAEAADAYRRMGTPAGGVEMLLACLNHRPRADVEAIAAKAEAWSLAIRDPEDKYWGAVDCSFCGLKEMALKMLRLAVTDNYLAYPAMDRDPFLANIRGTPEFGAIRALAIQRQKQFLAHGAERDHRTR